MSQHQHRWAPTGLYMEGGKAIMSPCLDPACDAELWQRTVQSVVAGPGMSINGMRLDIEDDPQGSVAKVVCRETALAYKEPLPLKLGDVVLDIGAHVGIVSIYLAKRYPGIRIRAFEPIPENYERLQRNIRVNAAPGITTSNQAITGDGRMVVLRGNVAQNSGGASILGANEPHVTTIGSISIRDLFENRVMNPDGTTSVSSEGPFGWIPNRCALLKIDCEGAEYEILEAAGDLLHRVDRIRGEFHSSPALEAQDRYPESLVRICKIYVPDVQVTFCRLGG